MKLCECGCGKEVSKEGNRFLKGHNNRGMTGENASNWKEKITKICPVCNKQFKVVPSREHQKFCSRSCRGSYESGENHPMYGMTGKDAPNYGNHHSEESKKKMSDSHTGKHHSEETKKKMSDVKSGKNNSNWKEKITKNCEVCGKSFEVIPSRKDSAKFCSNRCQDNYKTDEKITKTCPVCDKKFQVIPSLEHQKFCSNYCYGIYHTGKNNPMYGRTGKDAPGWGRTGENHPMYGRTGKNSPNYGKHHSEETKRKLSAAHQGITYDEWEDYATEKTYCPLFDEACRESNRDKYDRKCFICNLPESENITTTGKMRKLSVHHVDMDKNQGCDGVRWKLVPTCLHHHRILHTDLWISRIIYLLNNCNYNDEKESEPYDY